MRLSFLIVMVAIVAGSTPVFAAESPYSGMENREIKALSKKQIDGYLSGQGMRLALPAELNGYPGPKHVLEMNSRLGLSALQHENVQGVFAGMQSDAIALGERIVEAEAALDAAFASGSVNPELLRASTREIGLLKARLRFVHLQAHLETKALLTEEQVQTYTQIRGYHHSGH